MEQLAADDVQDEHNWNRRFTTIYRLRLSVLYHLSRERYFDRWDKLISMMTAVTATAAVGALIKKGSDVELWAAGTTAVLSLIPLVLNPAERARKSAQLVSEFRRLLAEGERLGERWTEGQCDQFASRVVEIESTEPALLAALTAFCQNQLNVASGTPELRVPLHFYERWLMHWVNFDASKLNERRRKHAEKFKEAAEAQGGLPVTI